MGLLQSAMDDGFSRCLEELGLQDLVKEADWKFQTGQKLKNMAGAAKAHVSSWKHPLSKNKRLDVLEKHHTGNVKKVDRFAEKHRATPKGRPGRLDRDDADYLENVRSSSKDKLRDIESKRPVDAGDWRPKPKYVGNEKQKKPTDKTWKRRGKAVLGLAGGAAAGAGAGYGVDRFLQNRKGVEKPSTKETKAQ